MKKYKSISSLMALIFISIFASFAYADPEPPPPEEVYYTIYASDYSIIQGYYKDGSISDTEVSDGTGLEIKSERKFLYDYVEFIIEFDMPIDGHISELQVTFQIEEMGGSNHYMQITVDYYNFSPDTSLGMVDEGYSAFYSPNNFDPRCVREIKFFNGKFLDHFYVKLDYIRIEYYRLE